MSITEPSDTAPAGPDSVIRDMWRGAAPGWEQHAGYVDARGAGVTEVMLERSAPRSGERVLELACGPGGVGLTAAERVGSTGVVVLSDLVPEMTRIAATRAQGLGLTNVVVRELDLQQIDEPDASYDVVVCREALMLVPDPARAAGEMRRVLRPGGRAVVAVWGPRSRNPWLGALFDAVTETTGLPVPPPGVPGPFSLQDDTMLRKVLVESGLEEVEIDEVDEALDVDSLDGWWAIVPSLAGPMASLIASLPADVAGTIRRCGEHALRPYETADGFHIPGVSLVASGRLP